MQGKAGVEVVERKDPGSTVVQMSTKAVNAGT